MRHKHSMTWNTARNLKYMEKENHTLQDQENGENTDKRGKSETHMVGP